MAASRGSAPKRAPARGEDSSSFTAIVDSRAASQATGVGPSAKGTMRVISRWVAIPAFAFV